MTLCLYSCLSYPAFKSHHFCDVLFVICGQSASTILFDITRYNARTFWQKKKKLTNACFDFIYHFCPQNFSLQNEYSEIL